MCRRLITVAGYTQGREQHGLLTQPRPGSAPPIRKATQILAREDRSEPDHAVLANQPAIIGRGVGVDHEGKSIDLNRFIVQQDMLIQIVGPEIRFVIDHDDGIDKDNRWRITFELGQDRSLLPRFDQVIDVAALARANSNPAGAAA